MSKTQGNSIVSPDSLPNLYIDGDTSKATKTNTLQPLKNKVIQTPSVICNRVSSCIELDIPFPANVAWTILGDFSVDFLANDLDTNTSDVNVPTPEQPTPRYQVNVSHDRNVREVRMMVKSAITSQLKQYRYTEKVLQYDESNLKYVYTRQPNLDVDSSSVLMSRHNNADSVYGLSSPLRARKSENSTIHEMELDLNLEGSDEVLPVEVVKMIASMENQPSVDLSLGSGDVNSDRHFINFIGSFRIVATSFTTSKLIWNLSAQPLVSESTHIEKIVSVAPSPTNGGFSLVSPRNALSSPRANLLSPRSGEAVMTLVQSADAAEVSLDNLDVSLCEELHTPQEKAERDVRHSLHQMMSCQLPYIKFALSQLDPAQVQGITYPAPIAFDIIETAKLGTEETFARLLVQQWGAQLPALEDTKAGKVGEGESLTVYARQLVPILTQAMEALGKEWERQQKREAEYLILKQRKPLSVAPRPLNPLHFVASYLMANNFNHTDKPVSQYTEFILDVLKQAN